MKRAALLLAAGLLSASAPALAQPAGTVPTPGLRGELGDGDGDGDRDGDRAERFQRPQRPEGPLDRVGAQPAGTTRTYTLRHGGLDRRVIVHLPRSLAPDRPAPLLFAFHGGGGHAERMADDARFGLIRASEAQGAILVVPNGTGPRGAMLATWNAGQCCGRARDQDVDDVGFVRALLATLRAQRSVDATRVYATGMSNGGMFTHRLACDAADLFRAIASVAGPDETLRCDPARPVAVLQIQARDDLHVPPAGGPSTRRLTAAQVAAYTSMDQTVALWARRDACTGPAETVLERPGVRCWRHAPCAGGTQVQACLTDTGGHTWPGSLVARRGEPPPSTALDANDAMWQFFNALPAR